MALFREFLKNSAIGVLLTAAAAGLRLVFSPNIGSRGPFLFHVLAVAVAAQIGGIIPGLMATALGVVVIGHFAPASDAYMGMVLVIFGGVGAVLSVFGEWRKRAEDERRKALEDLTQAHVELKKAHGSLTSKHEAARIGTFDWYVREGRVVWTLEMARIYGIQIHTFEDWKSRIHPEDLEQVVAVLDEAPKQHLPTHDHTFRIVRTDGAVRWIHSRRKYQYDEQGNPVHVMGVNMDITEWSQGGMAPEIPGGFLHVCSACRRIREKGDGEWYSMEGYLRRHSTARFSHGMCPDCSKQWLSEGS